jgi:hypothetical protein
MTTIRLTRPSFCSSCCLLQKRQSFPNRPTHWTLPTVTASYSPKWNEGTMGDLFSALQNSNSNSRTREDAAAKCLPTVPPIVKIPLVSLYQCRSGLRRSGWRQIEFSCVG